MYPIILSLKGGLKGGESVVDLPAFNVTLIISSLNSGGCSFLYDSLYLADVLQLSLGTFYTTVWESGCFPTTVGISSKVDIVNKNFSKKYGLTSSGL